jgi:hypothetical protein
MRWPLLLLALTAASLPLANALPAVPADIGGGPHALHGCGDIAPVNQRCALGHGPWTGSEPEPTLPSTSLFVGSVIAVIQGEFGATKIFVCDYIVVSENCHFIRDDHLQCCTEDWVLRCSAHAIGVRDENDNSLGIGQWSCDHTGG